MDVYDARKPLMPNIVMGRVYKVVLQTTGELSIYLDTGYEVRLTKSELDLVNKPEAGL